jgi:hypothetical protein
MKPGMPMVIMTRADLPLKIFVNFPSWKARSGTAHAPETLKWREESSRAERRGQIGFHHRIVGRLQVGFERLNFVKPSAIWDQTPSSTSQRAWRGAHRLGAAPIGFAKGLAERVFFASTMIVTGTFNAPLFQACVRSTPQPAEMTHEQVATSGSAEPL